MRTSYWLNSQERGSMSKEEIIEKIKEVLKETGLAEYRVGLAGSYARGEQTAVSDIDIVVDCNGLTMELMSEVEGYFQGQEVDILCLGLLKEEDEEIDAFMLKEGLGVNEESVYKTISKEVIWIEQESK